MSTRKIISGVTLQGFASEPPPIPGLAALSFLGNGYDANNGNRVIGAPAYTNIGVGPAYSSNFCTVNSGTATAAGIDTNIVETAAVAASGWTMFCVARTNVAAFGTMVNIGTGFVVQFAVIQSNNIVSGHPTLGAFSTASGGGLVADNCCDLGAGNNLANWKSYALVFPGGTLGAFTMYDITDGISHTPALTQTRAGNASSHFGLGYNGSLTGSFGQVDVCSFGIATLPLTLAQLQAIRGWIIKPLALRGISGA
jgi:hypothetical protein